jgi:hypothetical protein
MAQQRFGWSFGAGRQRKGLWPALGKGAAESKGVVQQSADDRTTQRRFLVVPRRSRPAPAPANGSAQIKKGGNKKIGEVPERRNA